MALLIALICLGIGLIVVDLLANLDGIALGGGIFVLILITIVTLAMYTSSVADCAELKAIYETSQNYVYAIDETNNALTLDQELVEQALIPIEGSIERTQVGVELANRITEYRDICMRYNTTLMRIRALDANPIVGVFYATPDTELKLITIK